jgi:diazepam-binding inhibitor (GABA receptor modulating acyl-CoA-binding protein)
MEKAKQDRITQIFKEYCEKIKKYDNIPQDTLLILYGLYKQSLFGDNKTPEPSFFDLKGKAKWNSWKKCHGESQYNSMKKYILIARGLK